MDHSFTSRHPLHSTIAQMSFVARSILMREFSIDHIGYGLKPAMGMGRKTCDIVVWVVATKLIQEQKRVQHIQLRTANDAGQINACSIRSFDSFNEIFYVT